MPLRVEAVATVASSDESPTFVLRDEKEHGDARFWNLRVTTFVPRARGGRPATPTVVCTANAWRSVCAMAFELSARLGLLCARRSPAPCAATCVYNGNEDRPARISTAICPMQIIWWNLMGQTKKVIDGKLALYPSRGYWATLS